MESENVLIKERMRKLTELREKGINPYPYSFSKTTSASKVLEQYESLGKEAHDDKKHSLAGRLMTVRRMGKASFAHLQDESGRIQLYFSQDTLEKETYKLLKKVDVGDILGISGTVFRTKLGELTIHVTAFEILTKTLRPLPEKYHGLKDKELRFRKRYLDLIMNQDVAELFRKRSLMIKSMREFLDKRGFMEVETPLLQTQYGGASARPFITHINAWDMQLYLSISPELYLKRLIVGGFEKVFTICKNFRNEGVDHSHNPEFTMLELYEAYADYNDMMTLIEQVYEHCALAINGTTKVKHVVNGKEVELDFKAPWKRMTTREAIEEHIKIDVESMSREELLDFCKKNKLEIKKDATWGDLVLTIFDDMVEDKIIQPTHVYDRPKEGTPLCKIHREDDRYNEQCEPIAMGMELGNMYSELNDPIVQRKLFEEQVEKGRGGDEEAHQMDTDYVESLEIGMPPTGGIGWGVDRMVIMLTGAEGIRDIILFPTMKPEHEEGKKNEKSK